MDPDLARSYNTIRAEVEGFGREIANDSMESDDRANTAFAIAASNCRRIATANRERAAASDSVLPGNDTGTESRIHRRRGHLPLSREESTCHHDGPRLSADEPFC